MKRKIVPGIEIVRNSIKSRFLLPSLVDEATDYWNGVDARWSENNLTYLRLKCSPFWPLDERNDPRPPFLGVQDQKLVEFFGFPDICKGAHVVCGSLELEKSPGEPFYPYPALKVIDDPLRIGDVTHVLVIQKIPVNGGYRRQSGEWELYDYRREKTTIPSPENDKERAYHFVTKTEGGAFWELFLFPVGYRIYESNKPMADYEIEVQRSEFRELFREALEHQSEYFETERCDIMRAERERFNKLREKCDSLNAQIREISARCEAFDDLTEFVVYYDRLKLGEAEYTETKAEDYVALKKRQAGQYLIIQPRIERYRPEIELRGGCLFTRNHGYAEVALAKAAFDPKESMYETRRFTYTPQGADALDRWMSEHGIEDPEAESTPN